MVEVNLKQATANQLATLLSSEMIAAPWTPADEATMWQQLLAAPLLPELARFGISNTTLDDACFRATPRIHFLGDLIGHPAPPKNVLDAVKRFAKAQAADAESANIAPMASVLYYAILATGIAAGMMTTKLPPKDLSKGLVWARDQAWLDLKTRETFCRALAAN